MSNLESITGTRLNVVTQRDYEYKFQQLNPLWVLFVLNLDEDQETKSLSYWQKILTLQRVNDNSEEWNRSFVYLKEKYGTK